MSAIRAFREKLHLYHNDRQGNFAMLFALMIFCIFLAVGMSIDFARMNSLRSHLSHALDAAATSTARELTSGAINEDDARKRFDELFLANFNASRAKPEPVELASFEIDYDEKTIAAIGQVDYQRIIPIFTSNPVRKLNVATAARYSNVQVEVAMMLDVTGSMQGAKIAALREAAVLGVERFLGQNAPGVDPRVRVALIPYSGSVNVGPDVFSRSVFMARPGLDGQQISTGQVASLINDGIILPLKPENYCASESTAEGIFENTDVGPDIAMVGRSRFFEAVTQEGNGQGRRQRVTSNCPSATLQPLSADEDSLTSQINNYNAAGGTAGHLGVEWTYRVLSEKWGNVFTGDTTPLNPDANLRRVAILMTDGDFNQYYREANFGGSFDFGYAINNVTDFDDDAQKNRLRNYPYHYGQALGCNNASQFPLLESECVRQNLNQLDYRTRGEAETFTQFVNQNPGQGSQRQDAYDRAYRPSYNKRVEQSNKAALELCTNMKKGGIEVYAVAFGVANNSPAADIMKACASENTAEATYYHAPKTPQDLIDTYEKIAANIESVTLTPAK